MVFEKGDAAGFAAAPEGITGSLTYAGYVFAN
jgi:hypothetical protein